MSGVASGTELIFMSESELSCSHLLAPRVSWEDSVTLSQLPDVKHSLHISHDVVVVVVGGGGGGDDEGDDGYIWLFLPVFFSPFAHGTGFILRCPQANMICLRQNELKPPPPTPTPVKRQ